jgi:hypothetical protein
MLMESRVQLTTEDLVISAIGMTDHMALLEDKKDIKTPADLFYDALSGIIKSAANIDEKVVDGLTENMITVRKGQSSLARAVSQKLDQTNSFAQSAAGSAEAAREEAKSAKVFARDGLTTSQADLTTSKEILKRVS